MNALSRRQRIRRINDHFVRFGETTQNLALNAEVASDFHIANFHDAFVVHHGDLQIFAAEDEGVVRHNENFPQNVLRNAHRRVTAGKDFVLRVINLQLNEHCS